MKTFAKGMFVGVIAAGGGTLALAGASYLYERSYLEPADKLSTPAQAAIFLGAGALLGGVGFLVLA